MQFDTHGLPRDNGATDFADSARLAGLLAMIGHHNMDKTKLMSYIIEVDGVSQGVRYPYLDPTGNLSSNNYKNFTRDQLLPLAAGLYEYKCHVITQDLFLAAVDRGNRAQNIEYDVDGSVKKFPDGADWLSPSHMNHLRRCANLSPTLLGNLWLIADICWAAWVHPMHEPNQLIAMCHVAGPFYMKLLKKLHRKLDASLNEYWGGWRNEPFIASDLRRFVEYHP